MNDYKVYGVIGGVLQEIKLSDSELEEKRFTVFVRFNNGNAGYYKETPEHGTVYYNPYTMRDVPVFPYRYAKAVVETISYYPNVLDAIIVDARNPIKRG